MVEDSFKKTTRLIIFLELVEGCNNTLCPSWERVCSETNKGGQKFMSEGMLQKIINEINSTLSKKHDFEVVDLWLYGNGDTLDHPKLEEMFSYIKEKLQHPVKISMAIDSRRNILHGGWYKYFDKIKMIHKLPKTFNWVERAKLWAEALPIKMSHKLITNNLTVDMWEAWKGEDFIKELKAVPFHNIILGTKNPIFTQREKFTVGESVPFEYGNYPGRVVRRSLIKWNGKLRRCLVSPTKYETIEELFLNPDDICPTCWPLTGSELAKFYEDKIIITPSANCVSDGYFIPPWLTIGRL